MASGTTNAIVAAGGGDITDAMGNKFSPVISINTIINAVDVPTGMFGMSNTQNWQSPWGEAKIVSDENAIYSIELSSSPSYPRKVFRHDRITGVITEGTVLASGNLKGLFLYGGYLFGVSDIIGAGAIVKINCSTLSVVMTSPAWGFTMTLLRNLKFDGQKIFIFYADNSGAYYVREISLTTLDVANANIYSLGVPAGNTVFITGDYRDPFIRIGIDSGNPTPFRVINKTNLTQAFSGNFTPALYFGISPNTSPYIITPNGNPLYVLNSVLVLFSITNANQQESFNIDASSTVAFLPDKRLLFIKTKTVNSIVGISLKVSRSDTDYRPGLREVWLSSDENQLFAYAPSFLQRDNTPGKENNFLWGSSTFGTLYIMTIGYDVIALIRKS